MIFLKCNIDHIIPLFKLLPGIPISLSLNIKVLKGASETLYKQGLIAHSFHSSHAGFHGIPYTFLDCFCSKALTLVFCLPETFFLQKSTQLTTTPLATLQSNITLSKVTYLITFIKNDNLSLSSCSNLFMATFLCLTFFYIILWLSNILHNLTIYCFQLFFSLLYYKCKLQVRKDFCLFY